MALVFVSRLTHVRCEFNKDDNSSSHCLLNVYYESVCGAEHVCGVSQLNPSVAAVDLVFVSHHIPCAGILTLKVRIMA